MAGLVLEKPCFITLEQYSEITGIDPCIMAGIEPSEPYSCPAWDCKKRREFIRAMYRAGALIENLRGPLCPTSKTLKEQHDYFNVPTTWLLQTRREVEVDMEVVVPEEMADPPCMTLIELVGEITIQQCEEVVAARIALERCACPMLPVDWCSATYEEVVDPETQERTLTITLTTYAYNLNLTGGVVSGENLDWLPETVPVVFVVAAPTLDARVMWQPTNGCCPVVETPCERECCHLQECCACVRRTANGLVEVIRWRGSCCVDTCCNPNPHHFELDVVVPGMWRSPWEEAIVSLSNNMLPREFCCPCSSFAELRYNMDVYVSDTKYDGVYSNPFGILTPGGKKAWAIVSSKGLTVGGYL